VIAATTYIYDIGNTNAPTNTNLFEVIPTLSQYRMATLVPLMLGVGVVGFRRFS